MMYENRTKVIRYLIDSYTRYKWRFNIHTNSFDYLDCNVDSKEAERFEKVEKMLDTIFKEQDKITEELIMMK